MSQPIKVLLLAVASAWALSAAAQGTQGTPSTQGSSAPGATTAPSRAASSDVSRGDRAFAEKAAQAGLMEVELGRIAQQKAASDPVRQFGARMVEDHTKANNELKQIAARKGIELPTTLDGRHRRDVDRLARLSGAEFDRAYMDHMVDDHRKDVKEFREHAEDGKDADLRAFAAKTLPVLQQHEALARTTYDAVKNSKRAQ